jgi:hypothetical protein
VVVDVGKSGFFTILYDKKLHLTQLPNETPTPPASPTQSASLPPYHNTLDARSIFI